MNKDKLKKTLIGVGKDILMAFAVVCIVMLALFAYCGIWPPMVVVESGSMQHSDTMSYVGVIDTGDMVFVKKVNGVDDVMTYVDGEAVGYSKYGTFGDVIIYRPNGLSEREDGSTVIPIIHRPVVWVELNETMVNPESEDIDYVNYTFDVPSLEIYGSLDVITLENYGHGKISVSINLAGLMVYYEGRGIEPHGGYITMGDNNAPFYDQPLSGAYEPILPEWIVGKAVGEIPWFGLVKLKVTGASLHGVPGNSWTGLYVTIFLLLFIPFMFDLLAPRLARLRGKGGAGPDGQGSHEAGAGSVDTPEHREESQPPGPDEKAGNIYNGVPNGNTEHSHDTE